MKFDTFAKKAERLKTTCFIVKNEVLEVSKNKLFLRRIGANLRLEKDGSKEGPGGRKRGRKWEPESAENAKKSKKRRSQKRVKNVKNQKPQTKNRSPKMDVWGIPRGGPLKLSIDTKPYVV